MKGRLDAHGRQSASGLLNLTSMDSYIGSLEATGGDHISHTNTEEDILCGTARTQDVKSDSSTFEDEDEDTSDESSDEEHASHRRSKGKLANPDPVLLKELEETKRAVEEVRDALRAQEKSKAANDKKDDDLDKDLAYLDARRFITIIPVGNKGMEQQHQVPVSSHELSDQQSGNLSRKSQGTGTATRSRRSNYSVSFKTELTEEGSGAYSDDNTDNEEQWEPNQASGESSLAQSYNQSEMSALQQLDEAMADETSDADASPRGGAVEKSSSIVVEAKKLSDTDRRNHAEESIRNGPPPPPPPAPPLPSKESGMEDSNALSVKRINWEKLDNRRIENTVWEKLHYHELNEVIRILELETQFSTKPSRKSTNILFPRYC
ncbi:uncharacterized protein LOC118477274 [Aplysia californica]|uniref:Uncharacterized protein LOC118477274 n=1 Tax=Aplysia californica TaxID=6500 RepID=A0ABM1VPC6_APLCA|nr:uncharacterized protein LOC118477274 [Aplysia californica]